eukprot:763303-Hanusia_phi.AAC.15
MWEGRNIGEKGQPARLPVCEHTSASHMRHEHSYPFGPCVTKHRSIQVNPRRKNLKRRESGGRYEDIRRQDSSAIVEKIEHEWSRGTEADSFALPEAGMSASERLGRKKRI